MAVGVGHGRAERISRFQSSPLSVTSHHKSLLLPEAINANDQVVLNCGYFADSFADCLETYGANVTQVKAEIGGISSDDQIVKALQSKPKLITITHGTSLLLTAELVGSAYSRRDACYGTCAMLCATQIHLY